MKLQLLFCLTIVLAAAGLVSAQMPVNVTIDQKGYMIGPGDEITGKVLGEPQFDFVATVDEDGQFGVPFVKQPIAAKCRTEKDLRTDVTGLLSKYLRDPQVNLQVTKKNSRPPSSIYGEVNTPQQIVLMRKATLLELLALSGGIKEEAGGMIQIFRTQPPLCSDPNDGGRWLATTNDPTEVPSRIYSLSSVKLGKEESNPIIYPGDVIVVQKASPVYITGEVVSAQGVYLKEGGMSLTEAIAKTGGVRAGAKTKDIKIYRYKANSKDEKEVLTANLDQIKKGVQKDIMLEPYDIIEVDKAKDSIAQTIIKLALGVGKTVVTSGASSIGYRVLY